MLNASPQFLGLSYACASMTKEAAPTKLFAFLERYLPGWKAVAKRLYEHEKAVAARPGPDPDSVSTFTEKMWHQFNANDRKWRANTKLKMMLLNAGITAGVTAPIVGAASMIGGAGSDIIGGYLYDHGAKDAIEAALADKNAPVKMPDVNMGATAAGVALPAIIGAALSKNKGKGALHGGLIGGGAVGGYQLGRMLADSDAISNASITPQQAQLLQTGLPLVGALLGGVTGHVTNGILDDDDDEKKKRRDSLKKDS